MLNIWKKVSSEAVRAITWPRIRLTIGWLIWIAAKLVKIMIWLNMWDAVERIGLDKIRPELLQLIDIALDIIT